MCDVVAIYIVNSWPNDFKDMDQGLKSLHVIPSQHSRSLPINTTPFLFGVAIVVIFPYHLLLWYEPSFTNPGACRKAAGSYNRLPHVLYVFSCDQAALWMAQSVRLSVCLWHLFHYVPIIVSSWNILELFITNDRSDVHAKGQDQRSKVKVTEVTTPLNRFRAVTPVWIHKWWWNDA